MRVTLLAEWMHQVGGCEQFVSRLCLELVRAGLDVRVFVATQPVHPCWFDLLGDRLEAVPEGNDALADLVDHVARHRPDVVHAIPMDQTSFRYAWLRDRARLVATEGSDGSDRCHWATYGPAMVEALPHFAAVHTFSSRARRNLSEYFGYQGPVTVIPPLCAFPEDQPLWARTRPSFRLAYWGRLSVEKGLTFLVESLAVLRQQIGPLELDLWGYGPLEPVLRSLAASCGERNRVHLRGPYPNTFTLDVSSYDACLMPSFFEGLPYSFLEALWCGVPSVVTRISGIPDLLEESDLCRLITPGHQGELLAAVAGLYRDYDRLAPAAPARRELVRTRCGAEALVPAWRAFYQNTSGTTNPAGGDVSLA